VLLAAFPDVMVGNDPGFHVALARLCAGRGTYFWDTIHYAPVHRPSAGRRGEERSDTVVLVRRNRTVSRRMSRVEGTDMSVSTRPPRAADTRRLLSGADSRRDGILEAALAVMSRKGFERASIAAIAGRAGVARATVYQHFCDKQDILLALAERITRRIIETVETWAPLPASPAAGERELRAMIDRRVAQILASIAANADATRLVGRLSRGTDRAPIHDILRKIDDHVVAVLTREIQAASGYQWARACDAQTAARFILGGLEKVANDAIARDESYALRTRAMAAEIGALVFSALAHRKLLAGATPP
jgi:AcrR family transcriptional regulator